VLDCETNGLQTVCESTSQPMNALSNGAHPFRAMINRVHRRNDREKNLGGADVARSFVAPDVLLSGLQCQPIRRMAFSIM
jgi:hypothetical protein